MAGGGGSGGLACSTETRLPWDGGMRRELVFHKMGKLLVSDIHRALWKAAASCNEKTLSVSPASRSNVQGVFSGGLVTLAFVLEHPRGGSWPVFFPPVFFFFPPVVWINFSTSLTPQDYLASLHLVFFFFLSSLLCIYFSGSRVNGQGQLHTCTRLTAFVPARTSENMTNPRQHCEDNGGIVAHM